MNSEIQDKDKLIESLRNEISEMKYEKRLDIDYKSYDKSKIYLPKIVANKIEKI